MAARSRLGLGRVDRSRVLNVETLRIVDAVLPRQRDGRVVADGFRRRPLARAAGDLDDRLRGELVCARSWANAACKRAWASTIASCARCWSVTSRVTLTAPTMSPRRSGIGEIVLAIRTSVPSARRRLVSGGITLPWRLWPAVIGAVGRGHELGGRLAQGARGDPEQLLRGAAPRRHPPVAIDRDDRVGAVLHERGAARLSVRMVRKA
jgi:hypothetical protein